jgi:hypothetical protein
MHRTNQQDIVVAKGKLAELKAAYLIAVQNYIDHDKAAPEEGLRAILSCQQAGSAYFNYAEEFVGNSDLLGAHKSSLWAQGFAEDCAEILKSMPAHFTLLAAGFTSLNGSTVQTRPGSTAYANMQRIVAKYLTAAESKIIMSLLENAGLPVYGFSNEAREFMDKKHQTIMSFSFGVVFVVVLLVISFVQPTPSSFQYTVFRTVLALAGGGAVAAFPGFIELRLGNWLRAGGGMGVLVLLYLWNPAVPIANEQARDESKSGTNQTNIGPNGIIINNSGTGIQNNNIGNLNTGTPK